MLRLRALDAAMRMPYSQSDLVKALLLSLVAAAPATLGCPQKFWEASPGCFRTDKTALRKAWTYAKDPHVLITTSEQLYESAGVSKQYGSTPSKSGVG